MDSAVLDRMSNKIHVGLPEYASRVSILTNLIEEKMGEIPERNDCLNAKAIAALAKKTHNLSGRALRALVTRLQAKRDATENQRLTEELIDQVTYTQLSETRESQNHSPSLRSHLFDFRHFTLARIKRAFNRALKQSLGIFRLRRAQT